MRSVFLCMIPVLLGGCAAGEVSGERPIEEIIPVSELDEDAIGELQWIAEHPYDLNTVSTSELAALPGVSQSDADQVIAHRGKIGAYRSLDEISAFDGGGQIADRIRAFVAILPPSDDAEPVSLSLRARGVRDLPVRRGFLDGTYPGSPWRQYLRLNAARAGWGEGGLLVEKDPGELMSAGFLSGYLAIGDPSPGPQLLIGDFRVQSGQGLTIWNGSSLGGTDPGALPARRPRGIVPHRSSAETGFLRGVAAQGTIRPAGISVTLRAFTSTRLLAGNADSAGEVTSLDESGLFRTATEVARRIRFHESLLGGEVLLGVGPWLTTGIIAHRSRLVNRETGWASHAAVVGIHALAHVGPTEIFAEVAGPGLSVLAALVGIQSQPSPILRLSVVGRYYPASPWNPYAAAVGRHATSVNEEGIIYAASVRPFRGLSVAAVLDIYRFPARSGLSAVGVDGDAFEVRVDARLSRRTDLLLRFSSGRSQDELVVSDLLGRDTRIISDTRVDRIRATVVHDVSKAVRLKARVERNMVQVVPGDSRETGMLAFQDMRLTWSRDLSVEARVVFFRTDSYASRVYEYENDVRGSFSVPALYGTGARWYVLLRCRPVPEMEISLRYAETTREGVREIGSGHDAVPGDTSGTVSVQADLRL